jgi:hypothetical protein
MNQTVGFLDVVKILENEEEPVKTMRQVLPLEQHVTDMTCELTYLGCPSPKILGEDEPSGLPPPKINFERRSSAPPKLMVHAVIERRHSGAGEDLGLKNQRGDLKSEQMTRSLPNLHCSRSMHNRSVGFSLNPVQESDDRESIASRVLEFERLLQDI